MNSDLESEIHISDVEDEEEGEVRHECVGLNKYFRIRMATQLVHCKVRDCKQTFRNWKSYNLKRHLKSKHYSKFVGLYPQQTDQIKQLEVDALILDFNAVELVTVNGQPFSLLNSTAVKGFLHEKVAQLKAKGINMNLCRQRIATKIDSISKEIIKILSVEMKDQWICLMLDICTKDTLSVLGINAQYMIEDEIKTRSLGVIELTVRHNALNIATEVKDYIEKTFGIAMSQVKAVVTDNAPVMLLTKKLLNKLALGSSISESDLEDDDFFGMEEEEDNTDENQPTADDEMEIENILNNNAAYINLTNRVANEYVQYYGCILASNPISCAIHTDQLAIKDTLAICDINHLVKKVNEMCKHLRTQVVQIKLKQASIKLIKPPLNNATRWNSQYLMVSWNCLLFCRTDQFR